ncbi:MAG: tetratricopeptide repeat protein [Candidatus Levybacteria bacterium]|nr:tetratricopeptide repeat protein [Candidatus Levybacteria bacterium]
MLSFNLRVFINKNKVSFLVLAGLVFLSYANSLNNSFVSDDRGIIINADRWDLNFIFSQPFSALRLFLYLTALKIGGLNPLFFRLINVFLHLGTVWLVYVIVSLLAKQRVGLFAASLFAVHPVLIESVTWISGGVYAQYSFFLLLSFLSYILSLENKKFYTASLIFFGFSLMSSEKAVVLPLILVIYELSFGNIKKNWKRLILFFSADLIFGLFFLGKIGQRISSLETDSNQQVQGYSPFLQIPVAISSYFELIFWPKVLTLYHSEMIFSQLNYVIRVITSLLFFGSIIYFFKRNKQIFFWFLFFIITLLPTLTPFGISWVVAERYVYLGSLGIFVIVSMGLERLTKIKKFKMHVFSFFIIVILALSTRTIIRNIDWENEDNLWVATGKTSPSSPNTHNNLGDVYGRHGDLNAAASEFQRAIKINPSYADAYHNLANTYNDMGKSELALKNYQKAAYYNPRLWQSYQNMAVIYFAKNDFKNALDNLQKAISLNPNDENLYLGLGTVYLKSGDKEKAKEVFSKIISIDPGNQTAKTGLEEASK